MGKTTITVCIASLLVATGSPTASADCREIWVDQAVGVNSPATPGTPNEPFKSITYALAVAHAQGWPEPWCVHIRPGSYDADPDKEPSEREAFPIVLAPGLVLKGADRDTCIIDGQYSPPGSAALLYGNDLLDLEIRCLTLRNANRGSGDGGAIELLDCSGLIEDCTIANCSAPGGGGMYLNSRAASGEGFAFISCTFSANAATGSGGRMGGGLLIGDGLYGDVSNCTFADNSTATGAGGGLSISGSLTGDITGTTFTGNTARGDSGAGLRISGSLTGSIRSCDFVNNSVPGTYLAWRHGGGFCVHGSMTGDVVDCSFTGNSIVNNASWEVDGGGFCVRNTLDGHIADCTFASNLAESFGGGFCVVGTVTGGVLGCTFTSNTVLDNNGGGFYVGALAGGVANCTFADNQARADGGGLYVSGDLAGGVCDCEFTGNRAGVSGDMRHGGGIYANGNMAGGIRDCRFMNNEASWGAGFRVNGILAGDVCACEFINDGSVISNEAVHVEGRLEGVIERCRFFGFPFGDIQLWGNTAAQTAVIRNCLLVAPRETIAVTWWGISGRQKMDIRNNVLLGPGLGTTISPAALFFEFGTAAESSEVHNNIITQTKSGIRVGPIIDLPIRYNHFDTVDCLVVQDQSCLGNDTSFIELLLDNFRQNAYQNPGFVAWPSGTWTAAPTYDAEATQTTLCDSGAAWPPGALAGLVLEPDLAHPFRTLVAANTTTTLTVWGDCTAYGTPGNLYQIADYHLSGTSPCLDTGDPAFVPAAGETDIDGQLRLWDGNGDGTVLVDRGAHEFGSYVLGDLGCDGLVNNFDIRPFVLAITNPDGYAEQYPDCDIMLGDLTGDGLVNNFDIKPFVELLTGG